VILIFFITLIFFRFQSTKQFDNRFDYLIKKKVAMEGVVVDDPEIRNGSPRFKLALTGGDINCTYCTFLVRTKHLGEKIYYGDKLSFDGILSKPEKIISEDGRTFDYQKFLSKDDIYYIADARDVEIVSRDNENRLIGFLYKVKHAIVFEIDRMLPSPHSFLGSGLIISGKGSMDKEMQEKFQIVGLIHIVVLSGSNVSIIGEAILRVFSFLPNFLATSLGAIFIVFFAIMTGGGATVIRSTIMSLIALYARSTGRTNQALSSLTIAGVLMVLQNPKILFHDPGFQLSFLASLGLIFYSERIKDKIIFLHIKFGVPSGVIELVSATLATQIFTLPYVINMSGMISVISLPVNILVLPVIPFTMLAVFTTSILSFIGDIFAWIPMWVSWILLSYELYVVDVGASISWSHKMLPVIPKWSLYLAYTLFLLDISLYKYLTVRRQSKTPQLNI
jgi:competence protein ComEC